MTQTDLLTKHVMGGPYKAMNTVGASSEVSLDDRQFKAMYNEEIQFLPNQEGTSCPSYLRHRGNKGWNIDCEDGWSHRDRY
ncbi:hypothetical protein MTR67_031130 [Solanum verrucosum]|uniref:Uncharacterized protein n=1 Tax=Solanum verrucosum TaxID=315347 RepID=A0AAF0ZFK2_SOLVR|nr:hypothetical protein MTR67_031130 [Solanum verrucosum]